MNNQLTQTERSKEQIAQQVARLLPPALFQGLQVATEPDAQQKAIGNVILTDQEIEKAIYEAKVLKYWETQKQSAEQVRQDMIEEIRRPWTWQDQLAYLYLRCDQLKIPREALDAVRVNNDDVVVLLCKYFTNDPAFSEYKAGFSLSKGLYLHGYMGVGKTLLLKLFAINKRQCYFVSSTRDDVQKLFMRDEDLAIEKLSANHMEPKTPRFFFQQMIGRAYDDLGAEEHPIKHYGTPRNIMSEILTSRYDNRNFIPMHSTHVTSNMNPDEVLEGGITRIEKEYGSRLWDRYRAMFNVIHLKGDSTRK